MEMYEIIATKKFECSLKKIKDKFIRNRILEKISELFEDPENKGKQLKGVWKVRVHGTVFELRLREMKIGDWRIFYYVDHAQKEVWLLYVDHRSRIFKRKLFLNFP